MPNKQPSPRRNATRKPSLGSASRTVVDLALVAPAEDEPPLEVVFDAGVEPEERAGWITRRLMREVFASPTALAAELVVSELMGMTRLACPPESPWDERSETIDALIRDVTVVAGRDGSAAALALLRVIAVLATPDLAHEAAEAAQRLLDAGVPDRPWGRSVGRPKFVRAWWYGDLIGYQESVSVMFDYAFREHVASVLIDHALGGGVKDCWVAQGKRARALRAVMAQRAADPNADFEDLEMEHAHNLLSTALRSQPCPEQEDQIRDVSSYLPVVSARVALLGAMAT